MLYISMFQVYVTEWGLIYVLVYTSFLKFAEKKDNFADFFSEMIRNDGRIFW